LLADRSLTSQQAIPYRGPFNRQETLTCHFFFRSSEAGPPIASFPVRTVQFWEGKARGGETLISETCYRLLSDQVAVGRPVREELKGVLDPIDLYPVGELKVRPQTGAPQTDAVTTCAWQARSAPHSGCD